VNGYHEIAIPNGSEADLVLKDFAGELPKNDREPCPKCGIQMDGLIHSIKKS